MLPPGDFNTHYTWTGLSPGGALTYHEAWLQRQLGKLLGAEPGLFLFSDFSPLLSAQRQRPSLVWFRHLRAFFCPVEKPLVKHAGA